MILGWRIAYMLSWAHSCHRRTHKPFIANPVGWLVFFVGFGGVCLLVEIIAIVQKKPLTGLSHCFCGHVRGWTAGLHEQS